MKSAVVEKAAVISSDSYNGVRFQY